MSKTLDRHQSEAGDTNGPEEGNGTSTFLTWATASFLIHPHRLGKIFKQTLNVEASQLTKYLPQWRINFLPWTPNQRWRPMLAVAHEHMQSWWRFSTSCLLPAQYFPLVEHREENEWNSGATLRWKEIGLSKVTHLWDSHALENKQDSGLWCLTGAPGLEEW